MKAPGHIVIVRLSSVGDVILATPVAAALRRAHPGARITWVADKGYLDLVRCNPHLDRAVAFDHTGLHRGPSGIRWLAREIGPADLVVDLQHKLRSVLLSNYLRPARRKTLVKRRGFGLVRALLGRDAVLGAPHQIERYLAVLDDGTGPAPAATPLLVLDPADAARAADMLPRTGCAPLIGIVPGARHATKCWTPIRTAALADRAQDEGLRVVLLGGDDDSPLAASVTDAMQTAAPPVCTGGSLGLLGALLARCDLVVSPDSGPAHMAAALGVAVVTLFGPTSPARWAPRGARSRVVRLDLPCSPCSNHGNRTCLLGTLDCMRGLDVDRVWLAVRSLLGEE